MSQTTCTAHLAISGDITPIHSTFYSTHSIQLHSDSMPATTRTRIAKPVLEAVAKSPVSTPTKRRNASTDATKKVPSQSTSAESVAVELTPSKRRKTTPKTPKPAPEPRPPIDLSKVHYRPSTLPVEPQFNVQDAMDHLIRFDPRFKGLFDAMKCRPFVEPFEALDPYRTLTTSIVGQQVCPCGYLLVRNADQSGQLDGSKSY